MKRIAVLTVALVLLLTILAGPVMAAGPGSAKWHNKDSQSGKFSVEMTVANGAQRIEAVVVPVDIELDDMDSLTFWEMVTGLTAGWDPIVLLGIDLDGDGKYKTRDFRWQFSYPGKPALLKGDTFIQGEAPAGLGAPDADFVQLDPYGDYNWYDPAANGIRYGSHYGPLADYQTASIDGIPTDAKVKEIKIIIGGSSSWEDMRALVDLLELNDNSIVDEPENSRSHFEVVTNL